MRWELITLGVAFAIAGIATFALANPWDPSIHRWEVALLVALAGLWLLRLSLRGVSQSPRGRFASLSGLGAVVIAAAFLLAELLVGPPQRVPSAPGQTYQLPGALSLAVVFPALGAGDLKPGNPPPSVTVAASGKSQQLAVGEQVSVRSYVLRAESWPAAYVRAWSPAHVAQTVTQPAGIAFVSPVLRFPIADKDGMPIDSFAVPALHREVRVKYYPGLPSRGIDIPFLQLEIDEENGGPLYGGVAVSGRPTKHAGTELLFDLGTYPVVSIAGAPDKLVYGVGVLLVLVGCLGVVVTALASPRS